jgi:hypothetical protein
VPICTTSWGASFREPSIRTPLTNVPFAECASRSTWWPSSHNRSAWWRETSAWSSTMSAPVRPIFNSGVPGGVAKWCTGAIRLACGLR